MRALSTPAPRCSDRATEVAHAWLRRPIFDELRFQANGRRDHPDALAAKILTAVLVLGIADEVVEKAESLLANV